MPDGQREVVALSHQRPIAHHLLAPGQRPHQTWSVLEAGYGPGVGIWLLTDKALSGEVGGVDCSEEMVDQAAARNAVAVESGRVELRLGSVERLPFENDTFDKALAINSMQIRREAVAELREIWHVLRPRGRVALGFTPYSGQSKEELTEMITAADLAGVHILEIDRDFCALAIKPSLRRSG